MPQWLIVFCDWLSNTPPSQLIQNVSWIIPTVQTVHILAIAVVMGAVGLLDLRLIGLVARRQSVSAMAQRVVPRTWAALVVLLLTGAVLAIGEPARSLTNPAFHLKMLLLATVISLTLFVQRAVAGRSELSGAGEVGATTLKLVGLVSLALWLGVIFAGRWIAYMGEATGSF